MANPRGNPGNKGGTGNPGYGAIKFVKDNLNKFQEEWWTTIVAMMQGEDKELKKFALAEFNKIQLKVMPNVVAGDEENPVAFIPIYGGQSNIPVQGHPSDQADIQPKEEG